MVTQFQGAFSDNALRYLVTFLVLGMDIGDHRREQLVSVAGALFAVPFIIFSITGGWLADRFSKRSVMMSVKFAEVGIMAFATAALTSGSLSLQMIAICLMGVHSAIFGPSKYGSLPELLPPGRLTWGNGIIEMLTFLAIILGMLFAGWLADTFHGEQSKSGLFLMALAFIGLASSAGVDRIPPADPHRKFEWNFLAAFWRQTMAMRADRDLWRANWGNAGFFYIAALVQMNLVLYATEIFHLGPRQNAGLLAALCLGVGGGSVLAGRISRGRIEYGLIPIGAALLAVMGLVLGWPGVSEPVFTAALAGLGVGGGLFIVPVAAVLQHRPPPEKKGEVQGAAGLLSWIGISFASATQSLLGGVFDLPPGRIFWFCALMSAVAGAIVATSRPTALPEMIARWRGPRNA
jgi:acyl-[acyl-carrier-protein]-phospholipid O-acyltransferase/long-chain-fatty-acid--[acyl-carrier-protein] ligase